MKHANSNISRPSIDRDEAKQGTANAAQSLPGTRWRAALAALVAAPVRLHRYRNFHAEVVEDAIRAYDRSRTCGERQ